MKLPAEVKTKWVEALRSGEFKQAKGILCDGTGYCCLGVLEQVTEGEVEAYPPSPMTERQFLVEPTVAFWDRIGAELEDVRRFMDEDGYASDKQLTQLMKMNDGMKWFDATKNKMVQTRKRSFAKIADWIDKHVETF